MDRVRFLKDVLSIYSPSYEEDEMAVFLSEKMTQMGFSCEIDEVGNVIGKLGHGDPKIVLLGHMDTVRGFLKVKEERGKIYGRGAVDAKGPLCAFILAAYEIQHVLKLPLAVIGAVEEEVTSSAGAHHIVHTFKPPKYCVVGEPSSWDGITLGYKGSVHIDFIIKEEKLHYSGRRITAAEKGVNFWNDLKSYCEEFNKGKKLFDALLPTLISLTSSDDDFHLELNERINIRIPPDFDTDHLIAWLNNRKNNATVHFSGFERAIKVDKNNPLVRKFLKSIRSLHGKPRFKYKTGTSDMNVVGGHWPCPMLAYGPGDSTLDHSPNEHIYVENFINGIEVMKKVLVDLK